MNFKNLFFLLVLTLTSPSSHGQLMERKFHISTRYSIGGIDTAFYNDFGIGFEWHVHKNIGLNYNANLMLRNDQYRHIHTPMGIVGGPILLITALNAWDNTQLNNDSDGLGFIIGLLILALPDGVSGHFSPSYKVDISPYANVLGIDFIKDRETGNNWIKYACSFGTRVHYSLTDNLTVNAFLETRKAAGHAWGIGGGIGFGCAFLNRE